MDEFRASPKADDIRGLLYRMSGGMSEKDARHQATKLGMELNAVDRTRLTEKLDAHYRPPSVSPLARRGNNG